MRLKFLFFPIVLIASIFIWYGFIWSEIKAVRTATAEKKLKTTELETIKSKQQMIESLGTQLTEKGEIESVIKGYLPENKTEERIINSVSYLASDANVALVDISLSSGKATGPIVQTGVLDAIDPLTGNPVVEKNSLKSTSVGISVSGEYDKIRVFLSGLAHVPIFNEIKLLQIAKQPPVEKDGVKVETNALIATVSVDFGHFAVDKADISDVANLKTELDNATIDALQKYVSVKSQSIGDDGAQKGKQNPFVVN